MSDAFISYSRKDAAFVQRLNRAFVEAHRVVWIDWQDIARGEDWWLEIERGVESADAFICVLSENWLASEICQREMSYATANHKRIIPIVRQRIEGDVEERVKGSWANVAWRQQALDQWDALRHLNWIFFDKDDVFETEFAALIKTLESDQPYIKAHTRYQNLALEWERSNQNPSYLLGGDNLTFAERWLKEGAAKEPHPTKHHADFIGSSRQAENERVAQQIARETQIRRFRRAAVGLGIVGALAIVAAAGASIVGVQSQQAAATATVAQGAAVYAQGTAIAQVAVAGVTLTAVPPTLTAVASAVSDAQEQQDIGFDLANASLYLADKANDQAVAVVNTMVANHPQTSLAYISRGLIYAGTKQSDKAIRDFDEAIRLDPSNDSAYFNRGSLYNDLQKYDQALADFSKAIALNPDDPDAYFTRATTYNLMGDYDKALADYNMTLKLQPDDPTNVDARGSNYYDMDEYDKAVADYTAAIKLAPDVYLYYEQRGLAYSVMEEYDKAIPDFDKAVELNPKDADAYSDRGDAYFALSEDDKALSDYSTAIEIDPQNMSSYSGRATIYYNQGQYAEAVADWEQVKALDGTPPPEYDEALQELEVTPTLMATATAAR